MASSPLRAAGAPQPPSLIKSSILGIKAQWFTLKQYLYTQRPPHVFAVFVSKLHQLLLKFKQIYLICKIVVV